MGTRAAGHTGHQRRAGVVAGSWDTIEALRPDARLVVTLKHGERLEGGFKALGPAVLVLTDSGGREVRVSRSDVGKIVAPTRDDLTNGALIGAGVGLAAALAVLAIAGSGEGFVLPSAKWEPRCSSPVLVASWERS